MASLELAKARAAVADAKKNWTKTLADFRNAFKRAISDQAKGQDIGPGSQFWMAKSPAWKEGYKEGWRIVRSIPYDETPEYKKCWQLFREGK